MQDAQAEILKVRHAKGPPKDGAKTVIQSFDAAMARPTPEIVGDFVEPIAQSRAKGGQGGDAQLLHARKPCLQSLPPFRGAPNGPILKDRSQGFPLVCDLPQPRELLLQGLQLLTFFQRQVLGVRHPQPATPFEAASLLWRHLTLQFTASLCQALLEVFHDVETVNGDGDAVPKCFPNCA